MAEASFVQERENRQRFRCQISGVSTDSGSFIDAMLATVQLPGSVPFPVDKLRLTALQ
jgi:hypothetical protein